MRSTTLKLFLVFMVLASCSAILTTTLDPNDFSTFECKPDLTWQEEGRLQRYCAPNRAWDAAHNITW
ncbi:unnamed protein product, partial [Mesorhabditis spiculigera]